MARKAESARTLKRGEIADPIYRAAFLVVTGPDRKQAVKKFCKWAKLPFEDFDNAFDKETRPAAASLISHSRYRGACFWFSDHKPGAATVAHEVTHAACLVMEYLNSTRLSSDDEVLAYYVDFLTSHLGKMLWR